jgi:hypothetical protein
VDKRFLEARLALNRDEVHAVNCAYADDGGEDTLDAGLVILIKHAGDEEAEGRHVGIDVVVGFSVVFYKRILSGSIFQLFVLNQGTYGSPNPSLLYKIQNKREGFGEP